MVIDGKLKNGNRTSVSIDDLMAKFLSAAGHKPRPFIREKMKRVNTYNSKDARMDILFEIASAEVINALSSKEKQKEMELSQ